MSKDSKHYSVDKSDLELALNEAVYATYIQAANGDREVSDDSDNCDTEDELQITISCSSTAANQSKLVVTPQASKEGMDISFTEEDQPAPQLHITNVDQPITDSFTK
ncbi:hypothetical protein RclHR1_02020024 [Rhizophagus clarus]|uniref:Uncharacterized protein n=1 Tax=Rhizophagus clarus TaxID=94130 RepID=A0A2Z6QVI3_9GLOM|nr:hypothetical protein RclHR1_02020024 [Rhizophagus clarus]